MTRELYRLTDEHRAQLGPWAQRWIANAMSTKPMDDEDRAEMRAAIVGMYQAADLAPPRNIVFVPSPLVGQIAAGFAAAIWHDRKTYAATDAATSAATDAATSAATDAATSAATDAATSAATDAATSAATDAATSAATDAATSAATDAATSAATDAATSAATDAATSAATDAATSAATDAATSAATDAATSAATDAATSAATDAATSAATDAATSAATDAATSAATDAATSAATDAATSAATDAATSAATDAATSAATDAATSAATDAATSAATDAATSAATDAATSAATDAATSAATYAATSAATYAATSAATDAATDAATSAATYAATDAATHAATSAATSAATYAATSAATIEATSAATDAATSAATDAATSAATIEATSAATYAATYAASWAVALARQINPSLAPLMLSCAQSAWRFYQGGNMWSAYCAYLSFFRHVAKLDLPIYDKWRHYEASAIHGGFRWVHPDFCIVSDRPRVLKVDEARRPHCDDGPSHLWADGFRIYHWHGYRLPVSHEWIIADRARLSPDVIDAEPNAELRRIMLEVYGFDRYFHERNALTLAEDHDGNGHLRRLMSADVGGEEIRVVEVLNGSLEPDGTRRRFILGAMPGETPHEAIANSYGIAPKRYREAVRT
ncbi:DUF6745 domain-containing protein [Hansschlegelia zhihuaiae]|uniref:DUF6745 domain-containing protein n=1 Tax=Hansschlegelia zhihuaiae TaxID=405005 RepID=UPI0019D4BDA5|nr:hypothetical protein [Hansschlegelia zhihuaiae]